MINKGSIVNNNNWKLKIDHSNKMRNYKSKRVKVMKIQENKIKMKFHYNHNVLKILQN